MRQAVAAPRKMIDSGFRDMLLGPTWSRPCSTSAGSILRTCFVLRLPALTAVWEQFSGSAFLGRSSDPTSSANPGTGKTVIHLITILQGLATTGQLSTADSRSVILCHSRESAWQVAERFLELAPCMNCKVMADLPTPPARR